MKQSILFLILALGFSMTSCKKAAGDEAKVADAAAVTAAAAGTSLAVNLTDSKIMWEGAKPTGTHTGTIALTDGEVVVADGKVTGGKFTIDMNSITVTDLEGDSKANLEGHLKGEAEGKEDHFFNVAKYPIGSFEITKATALSNDPTATHLVYGNLMLRDVTKEVGFKANVVISDNSVAVTTPPFTIDRTQWGVNYGSKSVFDNLGDKFVNDEIGLQINLVANKAAM